jgi:hypothetical protein
MQSPRGFNRHGRKGRVRDRNRDRKTPCFLRLQFPGIRRAHRKWAAVAQPVEHRIRNAGVRGSNPFRGTNKINNLWISIALRDPTHGALGKPWGNRAAAPSGSGCHALALPS